MEWFVKQEATFEKYRFGLMIAMLLFQSCIGSIAAMYAINHEIWPLMSLSAALSMGSNAMFIAQAKANVCLITFYLSVVINSIIMFALMMM
ncbi:MAG: hypothetical protein H3C31_00020 [Brumimicrobium sp.]|nr:hypothetical protein [Brumimicrobium sp.]MCO5268027.1 hypothetical protein [Brumimicrobium sp.]